MTSIQITQPSDFNNNNPIGRLPAIGQVRTFNYPTTNGFQLTEVEVGNNPNIRAGATGAPGPSNSKAMVGGYNPISTGLSLLSTVSTVLSAFRVGSAVRTMANAASSISQSLGSLFSVPSAYADVGTVQSRSSAGNKIASYGNQAPTPTTGNAIGTAPMLGQGNIGPIDIPGSEARGLGIEAPGLVSNATKFTADLAARAMGMVAAAALTHDKYQRTYNWEMLLPGMGILGPEVIGKYIQEVTFGEYSIDEVTKLRYGAETRGHAGVFSIPKVSIKFFKPVPDLVGTYLSIWKDLIVDNNGFFSPKKNYALTGYLIMLDTTGRQSGSYKLINMFPIRFPEHRLAYGDNNIVSYTIDFNVDRIEAV